MEVARFWRSQAQRMRLVGEKCDKCGEYIFPPRDICPRCRQESGTTLTDILKNEGLYTREVQPRIAKD